MSTTKGKALGVGGVFFKCQDRDSLGKWYRETLGFDYEEAYGCANFKHQDSPKGGATVWGAFKSDTDYFSPSSREFMINLIVDDLEQCLQQVVANGGKLAGEPMTESYGKFGWFIDPEGNKVELWEILNEGKFE